MITFLKGILVSIETDNVTLDVAGVGYCVFVPKNVINFLPPIGNVLQIYTYLNLREDGATLYGFITKDELNLFKKLITVSGVGPKVAINMMGAIEKGRFVSAIFNEDISYLTKLPGVGKKTAQRLILDLKDKLSSTRDLEATINISSELTGSSIEDALQALIGLGYQKQEVMPLLIKGRDILGDELSAQDLIRFVLKGQGKAERG